MLMQPMFGLPNQLNGRHPAEGQPWMYASVARAVTCINKPIKREALDAALEKARQKLAATGRNGDA